MSFITQYREKLHLKDVETIRRQQRPAVGFTGFQRVQLLFEATDSAQRQIVTDYGDKLRKRAKEVKLLAYLDIKTPTEELPFRYFCKKDLDWLWRPKLGQLNELAGKPWDLLINCSQSSCFPIEYLALSTLANFKIGAYTEYPNNYDLMVEAKDLRNYFEQVDFFLKKFSN